MGDSSVPVASAQGLENGGLVQSLGVPLVNGYPLPAIIVTDKEDTYALHQSCVALAAEVGTRVFLKG